MLLGTLAASCQSLYEDASSGSLYGDLTEISYTTANNAMLSLDYSKFDASVVFHNYENGRGRIKFAEELSTIRYNAFYGQTDLESIVLPNSLRVIGNKAFTGCTRLSDVSLNNSLYELGDNVFEGCTSLTTIKIPGELVKMGKEVFKGCSKLTKFTGTCATSNGKAIVLHGVLKAYATDAHANSFDIPNDADTIEDGTFYGATKLNTINIHSNVSQIGNSAFYNCDNLNEIYCRPTTPPSLGDYAFYNCSSDLRIYVPMDSEVDYLSDSDWRIYIDNIEGYDYDGGSSDSDTIPNNEIWYTSKNNEVVSLYSSGSCDASVISNKVTNGKGVIRFDSEITKIGNYAFYSRNKLISITLPNSIRSIGQYAFKNTSIESITMPESLTKIDAMAFQNCTNLKQVTIPVSVEEIYNEAFKGCKNLGEVHCMSSTPAKAIWTSLTWGAFDNNAEHRKIFVPSGTETSYRKAAGWEEYAYDIISGTPSDWSVIGSMSAWSSDIAMYDNGTEYIAYGIELSSEDTFKFRKDGDWAEDRGGSDDEVSPIGRYLSAVKGGSNIRVDKDGIYNIHLRKTLDSYCIKLASNNGAGDEPILNITSDSEVVFEAEGGEGVIYFDLLNTDTSATVRASTDATWISNIKVAADSVTYDVAANDKSESRMAKLTLIYGDLSASVTISQRPYVEDGKPAINLISASTIMATAISGDYTIEYEIINPDESLKPKATADVKWISNITLLEAENKVTFTVGDNSSTNGRSGAITISYGTLKISVTVEQAGASEITITSASDINLSSDECSDVIEFEITNPTEGDELMATCSASWIRDIKVDMSSSTVTYSVDSNFDIEPRSATIELSYTNATASVVVNQAGITLLTLISESDIYVACGSGSNTISYAITNPIEGQELLASTLNNATWIYNLTVAESRGEVTFDFEANPLYEERSATILLEYGAQSQSVTIHQEAKELTYSSIYYTTLDGNVYNTTSFDLPVLSNTYTDGVGEIRFEGNVSTIGENAFAWSNITSITLPESVRTISNTAFYNCESLAEVELPEGVSYIGYQSFAYCTSITDMTLPDSLTSIGSNAFYGCNALASITIGSGLTQVEENAFNYCNKLRKVYIHDIGAWLNISFANQSANPVSSAKNLYVNGSLLTNLVAPAVSDIKQYALYGCESITSIDLSNLSGSIGNSAFAECGFATSLTIGDGVTSISESAFSNCAKLETVVIGDSVTTIGENAFYYCSKLASLTIGDSVTTIGELAFCNCSSLKELTIPNSVELIDSRAFYNCNTLNSISMGSGIKSIGELAFDVYNWDITLSLYINDLASWCNIDFGSSSANPIHCADKLYIEGSSTSDITIPSTVTNIKKYAFYNCDLINSVTLHSGIKSIGQEAFYDCNNITEITIPKSVSTIGERAFCYCSSLSKVYCKPTTPPTADYYNSWSAFESCSSALVIYVPSESVGNYTTADGWRYYGDYIVGHIFEDEPEEPENPENPDNSDIEDPIVDDNQDW